MGRVNLKKFFNTYLVTSGLALLATTAMTNTYASQTNNVCTSGNKTIASYYTIDSNQKKDTCYSVAFSQPRTNAGAVNHTGSIYTRGDPFYLSEEDSYADYKALRKCLLQCKNSTPQTVVEKLFKKDQERLAGIAAGKKPSDPSSKKSTAKDTGKNSEAETPVAASTSTPDTNLKVAVNPSVAEVPAAASAGSDYEKVKAAAKANTAAKTGLYTTTLPSTGESVTFKTDPEKGLVREYNTGDKAGQWVDPDSEAPIHTAYEYTYNGHTYHGADEFKAATSRQGKLSDAELAKVVVTKYDEQGNPIGEKKSLADIKKESKTASIEEKNKNAGKKYDDCETSIKYAVNSLGMSEPEARKKYSCSATRTISQGAEIANQVLTTTGRGVINQIGATAAMKMQDGTEASAYDAAAKMQKTGFKYETTLGVANAAVAAVLARKANQHKRNLAELQDDDASSVATEQSGGALTDSDSARLKLAREEQTGARNMASMAAMKSTFVAAQSLAAAKNARENQKASESLAKTARDNRALENSMIYGYDPSQLIAPSPGAAYDPNQFADTANNVNTTTSDNSGDPNAPTGPMLGDGNDLGGGDDSLGAPKAAGFKAGAGAASGGGGGGGGAPGGGGGTGGGGAGSQEESKAAYASEFGTKERYESGGGAPGGKGATGKKEEGIDLNGLLAQFLPKTEEDLGSKNGILDAVAFGGNRKIADEDAPSYLDKNADLFQRIHETMSEKNRRGQIGI